MLRTLNVSSRHGLKSPFGQLGTILLSHHVLPYQQQRSIRKGRAPKKPVYRLNMDDKHKVVYPTQIRGLNADELENFNKWLHRVVAEAKSGGGGSSVSKNKSILNKQIKNYFETYWGVRKSLIKKEAKRKRTVRRKIRINRLLIKKMDQWNKLEDMREDKIIRERARKERLARREIFSFHNFLREDREKRRRPTMIEDEETFRKRLEEDQQNYLFFTPKVIRKKHRYPIGYEKRRDREIITPFLTEVRRRARIAELVEKREEAIAYVKWFKEKAEKEDKRRKEKEIEFQKKQNHWNQVLGGWYKVNNDLRMQKLEYMEKRTQTLAESRKEFLSVLVQDMEQWDHTPNECRFMRFRFVQPFPVNKTDYI